MFLQNKKENNKLPSSKQQMCINKQIECGILLAGFGQIFIWMIFFYFHMTNAFWWKLNKCSRWIEWKETLGRQHFFTFLWHLAVAQKSPLMVPLWCENIHWMSKPNYWNQTSQNWFTAGKYDCISYKQVLARTDFQLCFRRSILYFTLVPAICSPDISLLF